MFTDSASVESSSTVSAERGCLSAESARARLSHDIRVSLRRAGHAELRHVDVAVDGDDVRITGSVPSFYLKQLCQELAKTVAPRYQIRNELAVPARRR